MAAVGTASNKDSSLLKGSYGRELNNTTQLYLLPADAAEHGRLDIQHQMLKLSMHGLYLHSAADHVRRILAPPLSGSDPPAILDIGTGSGSWAVDMAEEFPHAKVLGIDVVPPNLARAAPPNCQFECHDVNKGMERYKNGTAFYHLLPELLRPGGICLIVHGDFVHGEDRTLLIQDDANAPDFSWNAKIMRTFWNAVKERVVKQLPELGDRVGTLSPFKYQVWMKEMPIWAAQDHQKFLVPIGPWVPNMTERERQASELLRQNFLQVTESWRPGLLINGFPEDAVDTWIAGARDEIINMKVHIYGGWQVSWALMPTVVDRAWIHPVND